MNRILTPGNSLGIVFSLFLFLFASVVTLGNLVIAITVSVPLLLATLYFARPRVPTSPLLLILFVYLVCVNASVFVSSSVNSLIYSIAWSVLVLLVACTASVMVDSETLTFMRWIIFGAVIQAFLAISQTFFGIKAPWGLLGKEEASVVGKNFLLTDLPGRALGSTGHPIPLGLLMGVGALLLFVNPDILRRGWRWPLIAFFIATIFLSGSRSAVGAIIVAAFLQVLLIRSSLRSIFVKLTVSVGVVIAALTIDFSRNFIVESLEGTESLTHRQSSFDSVPSLFERRSTFEVLFGSGYNSDASLFDRGLFSYDSASSYGAIDNEFVHTLAISGLVGALAFGAIIVSAFLVTSTRTRAALIVVIVMFFSFDVTRWWMPTVLFFALLFMRRAKKGDALRDDVRVEVARHASSRA